MVDEQLHEETHGQRMLRLISIANHIARLFNVEGHAKKAASWLTDQFKSFLWSSWKACTDILKNISHKVGRILGYGEGEEPPPGSIMLEEEPPMDGSIPIW